MAAQLKMVNGEKPRQFQFFPNKAEFGTWMENIHYGQDPKLQREPKWVSAEKPPNEGGMPLPNHGDWGELPEAVVFVKIWQSATSLEDAHMQMWWVSVALLQRYRVELNGWLEENAGHVEPLRELRSRRSLFGEKPGQARQAITGLLKVGYLVPRAVVQEG